MAAPIEASHASAVRPAGAGLLGIAGLLFLAFPVLRPWTPETGLAGAEAFASAAWVAAHTAGMLAFVTLTLGLATLVLGLRGRRWTVTATVLAGVGTALVLPYYGAETFGLQAIGAHALETGDAALVAVADDVRFGIVAVTMFGLGLVLLAAAGVVLALGLRRASGLARWSALVTGLGLATYLPQFFLPAAGRIGHGVLLAAGLVGLAVWVWRGEDGRLR